MNKPRLCEILGVRVGERFEIEDHKGNFYVSGAGYLVCETVAGKTTVNSDILCDAIQYPDAIIRKSLKITEEIIEDAKALRRILPHANYLVGTMAREIEVWHQYPFAGKHNDCGLILEADTVIEKRAFQGLYLKDGEILSIDYILSLEGQNEEIDLDEILNPEVEDDE